MQLSLELTHKMKGNPSHFRIHLDIALSNLGSQLLPVILERYQEMQKAEQLCKAGKPMYDLSKQGQDWEWVGVFLALEMSLRFSYISTMKSILGITLQFERFSCLKMTHNGKAMLVYSSKKKRNLGVPFLINECY